MPESSDNTNNGASTNSDNPSLIPITSHDSVQAFTIMRAEIEAIAPARAIPINTDVGFAVQTSLWMVGAIEQVRPELEKAVPSFPIAKVLSRFRGAALSLNYLQARIRVLLHTNNSPLVQQLSKRRAIFHNDLEGLVHRGLIDGKSLEDLKHTNNYQLLGYDVMGLVDLMQEHYAKFGGKCMTSEQELLEARNQANELFTEMGTKQFGPKANAALKLMRRQCFILLCDLWEELEGFLRFARRPQGDAATFVRSLYSKRTRKSPAEDDDEIDASDVSDDETAEGADDTTTDGGTDPLDVDARAINQTLAAATAASPAPIRPGFPGAPALRQTDED